MSTYLIDNWHIVFDWCWLMLIFQIDADWCWLILFYSDWWLLWHCEINEISKSVFACWNSSGTWLRLVLLAEERRRWGTFTEASLFSCFLRSRVATRSRGWVPGWGGEQEGSMLHCMPAVLKILSVKSVLKLPRINILLLKFTKEGHR